jgi:hypothetical protein
MERRNRLRADNKRKYRKKSQMIIVNGKGKSEKLLPFIFIGVLF